MNATIVVTITFEIRARSKEGVEAFRDAAYHEIDRLLDVGEIQNAVTEELGHDVKIVSVVSS